jgi:hypothetical protein
MKSALEEKRTVERGLKISLIPGNLWEPISTEGYIKGKTYIEAECDCASGDQEVCIIYYNYLSIYT